MGDGIQELEQMRKRAMQELEQASKKKSICENCGRTLRYHAMGAFLFDPPYCILWHPDGTSMKFKPRQEAK